MSHHTYMTLYKRAKENARKAKNPVDKRKWEAKARNHYTQACKAATR